MNCKSQGNLNLHSFDQIRQGRGSLERLYTFDLYNKAPLKKDPPKRNHSISQISSASTYQVFEKVKVDEKLL